MSALGMTADAFGFRSAFETTTTKVWDSINKGVSTNQVWVSIHVLRSGQAAMEGHQAKIRRKRGIGLLAWGYYCVATIRTLGAKETLRRLRRGIVRVL
jgi:hypothetical protein